MTDTNTNAVSPIESTKAAETQYLYYVIPSRPEDKKYLAISGENLSYPKSKPEEYRKRTKARETLGSRLVDLPGVIIASVEPTNGDYIGLKIRNPGTKIMIRVLVGSDTREETERVIEEYLEKKAPYLTGGTWHDDLPGQQTA